MDALKPKFKLSKSASEQNVYFTYVCLVKDMFPEVNKDQVDKQVSYYNTEPEMEEVEDEDEPIQVAHSKALHELFPTNIIEDDVNNDRKLKPDNDELVNTPVDIPEDDTDNLDNLESQFLQYDNPNILKLTRMKWLSDGHDGGHDASSPSLSPSMSPSPTISTTSSNNSQESCSTLGKRMSVGEKCLSTILRLDKEHNLFGLSNLAIVGNKPSKKIRKDNDRPVFHQTAIVQVCCDRVCCRYRSNTDLPASLKCGGCKGCFRCRPACESCTSCSVAFGIPCAEPPACPAVVPSTNCVDCYKCNGLKVTVNRKPVFVPDPPQLTPRASCILAKPYASRPCAHCPPCLPPSSWFPYLMPCFWPARPGAPCTDPSRCFHNPPCPPRRKPKANLGKELTCPSNKKCKDQGKNAKCSNPFCVGNIPAFKKEFENRYKT